MKEYGPTDKDIQSDMELYAEEEDSINFAHLANSIAR
jgi:hypothetical protein